MTSNTVSQRNTDQNNKDLRKFFHSSTLLCEYIEDMKNTIQQQLPTLHPKAQSVLVYELRTMTFLTRQFKATAKRIETRLKLKIV